MPAFVIGGSALVGAGGSIFSSLMGASGGQQIGGRHSLCGGSGE